MHQRFIAIEESISSLLGLACEVTYVGGWYYIECSNLGVFGDAPTLPDALASFWAHLAQDYSVYTAAPDTRLTQRAQILKRYYRRAFGSHPAINLSTGEQAAKHHIHNPLPLVILPTIHDLPIDIRRTTC